MATIAEHLKSKAEPAQIDWAAFAEGLQRESATVFVRVTMAPAPTVLNLWASYVLNDARPPSVADVLASDAPIDVETKATVPDPSMDSHRSLLVKLAQESKKLYQADPKKYRSKIKEGVISPSFLNAVTIVETLMSDFCVPMWFPQWLLARWPDKGRYSHGLTEDADPAALWVDKTKGVPVVGHLCADYYGNRAITAMVKQCDKAFMDELRRRLANPLPVESAPMLPIPETLVGENAKTI